MGNRHHRKARKVEHEEVIINDADKERKVYKVALLGRWCWNQSQPLFAMHFSTYMNDILFFMYFIHEMHLFIDIFVCFT